MGVIDFIVKGEPDASKHKKGLILAPLDGPDGINDAEAVTAPPVEDDPAVKEIEACCVEWRAERVKPHWVALHEPKVGNSELSIALEDCMQLTAHDLERY